MPEATQSGAEREARRVLAADPGTAELAQSSFEPVPGGFSNFAWCVTAGDGTRRFVRLASRQVERLGADHGNECRVLSLVAAAGWAPPVIRCDPRERLLVTQWIDAGRVKGARAGPPDRLRRLAGLLARLHASAVPPGVGSVDFATRADELAQVAGAGVGAVESRLHARAQQVFERLRDGPARVLCHHDVNPSNVVWDATGRPWLVDWEYAGLGDAAMDLASLASQHGLRAACRARLLGHYRAAGGALAAGRLELANWAFDWVQWLWYRASANAGLGAAGPAAASDRAGRLGASLRARASAVLRCDNAKFGT